MINLLSTLLKQTNLADRLAITILLIIISVLTIRLPQISDLSLPLIIHIALLLGFLFIIHLCQQYAHKNWISVLRGATIIGLMFTLYYTLGQIAFIAIPWIGDPTLAQIESIIGFGKAPVFRLEPYVDYGRLELFSFIYGFFIFYVNLSIFFGLIGRPDEERHRFITGFMTLYFISFLGYLFVPARGPVVFQATEFANSLQGGYFHNAILAGIESAGGAHGAFPSLHVGASAYYCFFDFYTRHYLRGFIYLPIVFLIALSTLILRYHYAIDIFAGLLIALIAVWVADHYQGTKR